MAVTYPYHIRGYGRIGYGSSQFLCGQEAHGSNWQYVGWKRDKRHSWCKRCLDLEPLAELVDTEL